MRDWYLKNRDKVKEAGSKYRTEKRDEIREKKKKYRELNHLKVRFRKLKEGAEKRGLEFLLALDEFTTLPRSKTCPYFPWIEQKLHVALDKQYEALSYDRIDNELGYEAYNIEAVSFRANTLKGDSFPEERACLVIVDLLRCGKQQLAQLLIMSVISDLRALSDKAAQRRADAMENFFIKKIEPEYFTLEELKKPTVPHRDNIGKEMKNAA